MTQEPNGSPTDPGKNPKNEIIKPPPINPNNQPTLLQEYQGISDHAHKEIDSIYTLFKLLLAIGTFGLAVALGLGTYFIRSHMEHLKTNILEDITKFKNEVETRVDKELSKESIQTLITEKITERVKIIADELIEKQVKDKISPTINTLSNELSKIQETNKVAEDNNKKIQKSLNEVKISIEFISTVLNALGDNSKAFENLGIWANNISNPYSKISRNLYLSIRNFHRQQKTLPWSYHLFSEEQSKNIDFPTLPFHKFIMWLHRSDPLLHMDLIGKILGRPDIPEKKKISFLIKVLRKSNNLKAKNRAGTLFEEKTGTPWDPFLYEPLYKKWNEIKYPAK